MTFTIDPEKYRVVDLSYEVVPPGTDDRPFVIERGLLADRAFKYDVTRTHSHVGTHVEAPAHFYDGGKDTTQLPLDRFFGRGILLEVDDAERHRALGADYLEKELGGMIREGDSVICRNNDRASLSGDRANPHLTPEAAEWLRDHKIKMLGIDTHVGLSDGIPNGRKLHDILMSRDICLIEFLDNLDQLTKKEFFLMALPFKVQQMDSSWARVIAIEER